MATNKYACFFFEKLLDKGFELHKERSRKITEDQHACFVSSKDICT